MTDLAPPRLALVDISSEPCYVVGFPAYVALTLTTFPENASLRRVPFVGWQGTFGMVGLTLARLGSEQAPYQIVPRDACGPDSGVPTTVMAMGEHRRLLIDLTEVLPEELEPGDYQALFSFGPTMLRTKAGPVPLQFRAPTPEEQQTLDALANELKRRGSWGQWTSLAPLTTTALQLPKGTDDPLRFNWTMKQLLHGPQSLANIPLALLDALDGLFVPEREVLRAELLAVRDPVAFANQLERLRQEFPGLGFWFELIEARQTEIAWAHRTQRT